MKINMIYVSVVLKISTNMEHIEVKLLEAFAQDPPFSIEIVILKLI